MHISKEISRTRASLHVKSLRRSYSNIFEINGVLGSLKYLEIIGRRLRIIK